MEKSYCLHHYAHCMYIHILGNEVFMNSYPSSARSSFLLDDLYRNTCIVYDKERTNVLSWGDLDFEKDNEDHIRVDGFLDQLSLIFKKDKANRNQGDKFLIRAVSDYMSLAVIGRKKSLGIENYSSDEFHYAFIAPSEWESEITEEVFRPMFIRANLISKDDHDDRFLLYSDIECVCYRLQERNIGDFFKRGINVLLCRFTVLENDKMIIKLDVIQVTNSISRFSASKALRSSSLSISRNDIIDRIKLFLQAEIKLSTLDSDDVQILADDIYNCDLTYLANDQDVLMKHVITDTSKWWDLNESQIHFIKSIRVIDLCHNIGTDFLGSVQYILSNNVAKEYKLITVEDQYSSETHLNTRLFTWMEYMLECSRLSLKKKARITRADYYSDLINQNDIISGAGIAVMEVIQDSNMYSSPRQISAGDPEASSSVFQNSAPNAIISIDISLKSTIITYTLLNKNGLIKKVFDNNYFATNKCLPSLELFYSNVSNTITLNVKSQFITFAEKYLLDNSDQFCIEKHISKNKERLVFEIGSILNNNLSPDETLVSTKQKKYIKAFLLMYMFYVREIILRKPPIHSSFGYNNIKIGYSVTVEKILLDNVTGTKENFRELIFAAKLLPKDDASKKLRTMTLGEELLPLIQESLKINLTIRSNFVLAQMHEDYIQLTLNQVVTTWASEEGKQEAIILQDKMIPIQNIYDSSCLAMWENIIENRGSIQLCNTHDKSNGFDLLELFSLKRKVEFFINLKKHISDNILNGSSVLSEMDKNTLKLSASCSCSISLTVIDIIDICFKPILQQITIIVLGSLINNKLFGIYTDIDYIFGLIHFNNNKNLQNILTAIMEEKAEYFNPKRGIETDFLVVPKLTSQLSQLVFNGKLLSYNWFRFGALHQVFNSNYSVVMRPENINDVEYTCKNKITDTESITLDENTAFRFFKKGGIIENAGLTRIFYLNTEKYSEDLNFTIIFTEYKSFDCLGDSEIFQLTNEAVEPIGYFQICFKIGKFKIVDGLPIMVSVAFQSHSSTFLFSARILGNDINYDGNFEERGELLTLDRF